MVLLTWRCPGTARQPSIPDRQKAGNDPDRESGKQAQHVFSVLCRYTEADLYHQYHRRLPPPSPEGHKNQKSFSLGQFPFEAHLLGYAEYPEEMDTAIAEVRFDSLPAID
jgi:hypothetical protein